MNMMTGQRLRLEYFDQNEDFRSLLPRDGTVLRQLSLSDWGDDWYVVEFDEPLDYGNRQFSHVLVRSRWAGYAIGDPAGTSVFLLLPRSEDALDQRSPTSYDFDHVAWATAIPVPAP